MNAAHVVQELEEKYPGKKILLNNQDNPTEIICEIDPSSEHPEYSKAVAVIDKSAPHYHKKTTEIYKVLDGTLLLFLNGKKKIIPRGNECQVKPWTVHWAEGNATWVEVSSTPGWVPNDHILLGKEEQIHIVPYNPSWPDTFEQEKVLIEETLSSWIIGGVHHIGSTSVPGLSAKPIIDIMVGVRNLEEAKPCIDLLLQIHYQYFPYRSEIMHWFSKPSLEHRTHHVYLMDPTDPEWNARLSFRDYLRLHPETKQSYEKLKRGLAEEFRDDREAYTEAKTEFIKRVIKKASG